MPNRIIRDWTDSDRVNQLSVQAEVFFTRLIQKADDHGGFYGQPAILKAQLFPLRSDSIRETDISRWIAECVKAGLIVSYEVKSKPYVRIIDFGQRLRSMKSKFPPTPDSALPTNVSRSQTGDGLKRRETEEETEEKVKAPAVISNQSHEESNAQPVNVPWKGPGAAEKKEAPQKAEGADQLVHGRLTGDGWIAEVKESKEKQLILQRQLRARFAFTGWPHFWAALDGFAGKFDGNHQQNGKPTGGTWLEFNREWGWYITDMKKPPEIAPDKAENVTPSPSSRFQTPDQLNLA